MFSQLMITKEEFYSLPTINVEVDNEVVECHPTIYTKFVDGLEFGYVKLNDGSEVILNFNRVERIPF